MSVTIDPANVLTFKRPLTRLVEGHLTVRNPDPTFHVAFKVKTTAPRQYCVRPNSGKIAPGETVQIQILLQPLKEDPPKDFRCKDKFLVQSVLVAEEHSSLSIAELWPVIERGYPSDVQEQKVRCAFLDADGGGDESGQRDGAEHRDGLVAQAGVGGGLNDGSPPDYKESSQPSPRPITPIGKVESSSTVPQAGSSAGEREDSLRRQLQSALEQLEQARKQTSELRQRRPDATSTTAQKPSTASSAATRIASASASQQFSVEVVALVAVLSFLFGYLFF